MRNPILHVQGSQTPPTFISLFVCVFVFVCGQKCLCARLSPKKPKWYSVERWDAHLKAIQFCLVILILSLNIRWQGKRWCRWVRLYVSNVLTCLCSFSNMATMRQDEEGRFPGPPHPHRNPQAPPWLVVVPWGKSGQLSKELLKMLLILFLSMCSCTNRERFSLV